MLKLVFDAGSILLHGLEDAQRALLADLVRTDTRVQAHRSQASHYRTIVERLRSAGITYEDAARAWSVLDLQLATPMQPRPHQVQALQAWEASGRRALVALPTGSGKSFLAVLAMERCRRPTLILVPTIDLLQQWQRQLAACFGRAIGALGGGEHDVREITVSTYDSALIHMERIGNRFGLLICDEAHHLPSEKNRLAALMCLAPFRLGLTATPERTGQGLQVYDELTGPLALRIEIDQLKGSILSPYDVIRCELELEPDEALDYAAARAIYLAFLEETGISFKNGDGWARFLFACSRRQGGKEALAAFRRQKEIARSGRAKMRRIWQILLEHSSERIIIFTADNATAYDIGRRFLLPVLTHHTKPAERKAMLQRLRSGEHPALVTSKVLNEGVDVPEVSIGVVVSGSGAVREHVQRLGRILRRSADKHALLYELISAKTSEFHISERRRNHAAYGGGQPS